MVEEIVHSILEAEDRAQAMQREARAEARRLLAAAQEQSVVVREEAGRAARRTLEEGRKAAAAAAEEEYSRVVEEGRRKADGMIADSEARSEDAVSEIVRLVLE